MELKWQACQAASDQPHCEVVGEEMVGRGRRGMSQGATPDGGLLSRQGALSGQRGGGGV